MNKSPISFFIVIHPPKQEFVSGTAPIAHSSPMGIRHIETKMALLDGGGRGAEVAMDPSSEASGHAFPKWAADRTFRGDGLIDAIGPCASARCGAAICPNWGRSRHAKLESASPFLTRSATSLPNLLRCTRLL